MRFSPFTFMEVNIIYLLKPMQKNPWLIFNLNNVKQW